MWHSSATQTAPDEHRCEGLLQHAKLHTRCHESGYELRVKCDALGVKLARYGPAAAHSHNRRRAGRRRGVTHCSGIEQQVRLVQRSDSKTPRCVPAATYREAAQAASTRTYVYGQCSTSRYCSHDLAACPGQPTCDLGGARRHGCCYAAVWLQVKGDAAAALLKPARTHVAGAHQ